MGQFLGQTKLRPTKSLLNCHLRPRVTKCPKRIPQICREERRKKLSSTYMFECNCDACRCDFPTLKGARDTTAKGLRRQLDKMLSSYQQSFSMGDLEQVGWLTFRK